MRIIILSHRDLANPQAGGSEIWVDNIACGAVERGHEVVHVCGGPVGERDYEVIDAGGRFPHFALASFKARRALRNADLVVEVVNGMPYFSPLWWRGPRLVVVHHVHRDMWPQFFSPPIAKFGWALERIGLRRVHRNSTFLAVSPSTASDLADLGVNPEQIRIVENGVDVDPDALESTRAPEPMFLALGRLVMYKRVGLLVDMWQEVQPVVGGRLVIVGDGPDRPKLEARGVPGVEFRGFVDEAEKQRLLCEAWFLVHGASHEGWGVVLMEGAAHRTPAVAFDVPGVRDCVIDGETALLAADRAQFEALWIELAKDPERRRSLGAAAYEWAREHGWERNVERFLEFAAAEVARGSQHRPHRPPRADDR